MFCLLQFVKDFFIIQAKKSSVFDFFSKQTLDFFLNSLFFDSLKWIWMK